jgi:ABC-type nitrate/sulfonate/bicarbonate transport system substrate-binding protein
MNILDSSIDKFASIQNGLAVHVKTLQEKPELVKKMLRAKAKGGRYFEQNEKEVSQMLAKMWNVELPMALESYRMSKPAFTGSGIPSDEEIKEYLALEAQILKLPAPVEPSQVFDFSLRREVNKELGIK